MGRRRPGGTRISPARGTELFPTATGEGSGVRDVAARGRRRTPVDDEPGCRYHSRSVHGRNHPLAPPAPRTAGAPAAARVRATVARMSDTTSAILVAAAMSGVGIVGDYFLKRASQEERPLATWPFLVGLVLYASTAFAWVFLMRYLKLATIGVIYSV